MGIFSVRVVEAGRRLAACRFHGADFRGPPALAAPVRAVQPTAVKATPEIYIIMTIQ